MQNCCNLFYFELIFQGNTCDAYEGAIKSKSDLKAKSFLVKSESAINPMYKIRHVNPNGVGGTVCPHFFQKAFSPRKKGSDVQNFLTFPNSL